MTAGVLLEGDRNMHGNRVASGAEAVTRQIEAGLAALVGASPGELDTLNELAAALAGDPDFATTVTNALAAKAVKSANLSDLTSASSARTNLGLGGAATLAVGTTGGTVAAGDDSRLTNARTPTAHQATHEPGGTDPLTVDAAAGTGSLRTIGTGATQAAAGNDSRIVGATQKAANLSDLTNPTTARTNLGFTQATTIAHVATNNTAALLTDLVAVVNAQAAKINALIIALEANGIVAAP